MSSRRSSKPGACFSESMRTMKDGMSQIWRPTSVRFEQRRGRLEHAKTRKQQKTAFSLNPVSAGFSENSVLTGFSEL